MFRRSAYAVDVVGVVLVRDCLVAAICTVLVLGDFVLGVDLSGRHAGAPPVWLTASQPYP